MPADGEFDQIGNDLAGRQRGLHALVPHSDAIGDSDGAKFPRGSAAGRHALLDCLRLPHQRNVARSSLVPAGGNPNEGLMDLLASEPHGVIIGTMGCPFGTLGHVPAGQLCLEVGLGVHFETSSPLFAPAWPFASVYAGSHGRFRGTVWPKRGMGPPNSGHSVNVLAMLRSSNTINDQLMTDVTLGSAALRSDRNCGSKPSWSRAFLIETAPSSSVIL